MNSIKKPERAWVGSSRLFCSHGGPLALRFLFSVTQVFHFPVFFSLCTLSQNGPKKIHRTRYLLLLLLLVSCPSLPLFLQGSRDAVCGTGWGSVVRQDTAYVRESSRVQSVSPQEFVSASLRPRGAGEKQLQGPRGQRTPPDSPPPGPSGEENTQNLQSEQKTWK